MGISCREYAAAPGQRQTPSWTYEGEERKKKQGEMNGVGGRGAEYESEAEERVRWLFIEMRKLALLRCGPAPETSPIKLQYMNLELLTETMLFFVCLFFSHCPLLRNPEGNLRDTFSGSNYCKSIICFMGLMIS